MTVRQLQAKLEGILLAYDHDAEIRIEPDPEEYVPMNSGLYHLTRVGGYTPGKKDAPAVVTLYVKPWRS